MTAIRHDFRSDTVTRPTEAMRAAMAVAEVGDDVYGDDPTVAALETRAAEMLGKQAGLFVPTGTMSNLLGLLAHCGRGEAFISSRGAHCYAYEGGNAAIIGSLQPQPLQERADGTMDLQVLEGAIHDGSDPHFAETRLIALENTFGGQILPQDYVLAVAGVAQRHSLGLHLDGARIFNAAVGSGREVADLALPFDTVSMCLSKGLGAPVGSVLVGRTDLINKARRLRKMVGGGMRQAGIIAAGGLHALEHHVARLADDHARARRLAEGLAQHAALDVVMPHTNIVFVDAAADVEAGLRTALSDAGVAVTGRYGRQRWVTHLDITDADIDAALSVVDRFFAGHQRARA
jgi:threonine aldolase